MIQDVTGTTYRTVGWPALTWAKIKFLNSWLHKPVLVTLGKVALQNKKWTDLSNFRGRSILQLFTYSGNWLSIVLTTFESHRLLKRIVASFKISYSEVVVQVC